MDLYFLRHGVAVERGTPGYRRDADRPLTPKGKRKLRSLVEAFEVLDVTFDWVLSSPYVRARQTAEIVADALKLRDRFELVGSLAPGGDLRELVRHLRGLDPLPENVLLVGHEPDLGLAISRLISGGTDCVVEMKKGGLCKLSADELTVGRCAVLRWLLTPGQLGFIASQDADA